MEEANGIRMKQLKICILAGIWSFLMTGCSALYSAEPLVMEAESTKVYVEMKEEVSEEVPVVSEESKEEDVQQEGTDEVISSEVMVGQSETVDAGTDIPEAFLPELLPLLLPPWQYPLQLPYLQP